MKNVSRLAGAGAIAFALFPSVAWAAPKVWAIDDGEKIKQTATGLPLENGTANPVWSPNQPIELFALRGETIAFQIIVEADASALSGVSVDLASLSGPNGASIANAAGATDPTSFVGRPIERFVEHYFNITRTSASPGGGSFGWAAGSQPIADWTGWMPDALIPVEVAPAWSPYPMQISANQNGAVWIDVTVPEAQAPGMYTGTVVVAAGGSMLASLPVNLTIYSAVLPDRPVDTMLYYDWDELDNRIGNGNDAEAHFFKLLRRHHLTAMHSVYAAADVTRQQSALDGTLYTAAHGYEGSGEGVGDGIVSIGSYGDLGAPTASTVAKVSAMADALASGGVLATSDVFLYAIDETCGSPLGADWKSALAAAADANAQKIKVGWTCSSDPTQQPVDIPIVTAANFNPTLAAAARAQGKLAWIYNGHMPETGAFMTDSEAIEPRVNGWIGAMTDIGRWFYWETTFWYDNNSGGAGPYDPFVTAETFDDTKNGDHMEGDGVLVYPGRQVDMFTNHSIGMTGVLASIRLKNFRRGVEDAGYYQLAHAASPAAAEAIANGLLPKILSAAKNGSPASWASAGKPFFDARQALLALIPMPVVPGAASSSSAGVGGATASSATSSSSASAGGGIGKGGAGAGIGGGSASSGAASSVGSGGAASSLEQSAAPGNSGCACSFMSEAADERARALVALGLVLCFAARRRRRRHQAGHSDSRGKGLELFSLD